MVHNKRETIHNKFKELLEEFENENMKVIYITYESGRLKIAFWNEEYQNSYFETLNIERN